MIQRSTLRPFILLTLNSCRSKGFNRDRWPEIIDRLKNKIGCCDYIVISEELHKKGDYHLHVAIKNNGASKNTYLSLLKEAFPEFSGREIHAKANFTEISLLGYVTKYSNLQDLFVRQISKEDVAKLLYGEKRQEKKEELYELLRRSESFEAAVKNCRHLTSAFNNIFNLEKMYHLIHAQEKPQPILERLSLVGLNANPYLASDLGCWDKVLSWLSENLAVTCASEKPLYSSQLFIWGRRPRARALFLRVLYDLLVTSLLSSEKNEFSILKLHADLWVIDNWTNQRYDFHILEALLSGKKIKLASKGSLNFIKRINLPIVLSSGQPPRVSCEQETEALTNLLTVVEISDSLRWDKARLAQTLLERIICFESMELPTTE